MKNAAERVAAAEASMVLTAICPMLPLVAERVDPALNPNHPNASSRVPNMTMGMWCRRWGGGLPMGSYFPRRGPSIQAMTSPSMPPWRWTTDDPAKSTAPWAEAGVDAKLGSQPPPTSRQP